MSKHSPGPWRCEPDKYSKGALWVLDANGVAVITAQLCEQPLDMDPADARLIAAAPELLEMLRTILEAGRLSPSLEAACALIRRIEGEG